MWVIYTIYVHPNLTQLSGNFWKSGSFQIAYNTQFPGKKLPPEFTHSLQITRVLMTVMSLQKTPNMLLFSCGVPLFYLALAIPTGSQCSSWRFCKNVFPSLTANAWVITYNSLPLTGPQILNSQPTLTFSHFFQLNKNPKYSMYGIWTYTFGWFLW